MTWVPVGMLVMGMAVSCYTDVRDGLILNAITFPMMLAGILWHLGAGLAGWSSLPWSFGLVGWVAATVIHVTLWNLGVEKGGDAKLIMGHGALMGWAEMVELTWWCAVLYIPVGIIWLTALGKWANFWSIVRFHLHNLLERSNEKNQERLHQMLAFVGFHLDARLDEEPPLTLLRTAPLITAAAAFAFATDWLRLAG